MIKRRIVLLTAALSLVGFFLEVGPLGAFSLANKTLPVFSALWLEIRTFGFVAYLALAASAAVGLHMSETEPTPKKEEESVALPTKLSGDGDAVGERVRVRPELHQTRMLLTALGGYVLLKGLSIFLMGLDGQVSPVVLAHAFQFGLIFVGLGWFVLWQFLRWVALQHRWIRLQDELIGGNVLPIIALFYAIAPLSNIIVAGLHEELSGSIGLMVILLNFAVFAAALILWRARPYRLRRTVTGLAIDGGIIVLLTLVLGFIERTFAV